MNAHGLRPSIGRPDRSAALGIAAAASAAVWTLVGAAAILGLASIPLRAMLLLPIALGGLALLAREDAPRLLHLSAGWTVLLVGALFAGALMASQPLVIAAIPLLALSAVVCSRFPTAATFTVLVLAGFYGTIIAFTGARVYPLVDLVLAGMWLGAIWAYIVGGRWRRPVWLWPELALLVVFIALTFFAIPFADSIGLGLQAFRAIAWYLAAFILVGFAPWPDQARMRIVKALLVVAFCVGSYSVFRWLTGLSPQEQQLFNAHNIQSGKARFGAPFPSGPELGAWTSPMIPLGLMLAIAFRGLWRAVAVAATLSVSVALLASDSRSSFVAAVIGVIVVIILFQAARAFRANRIGTSLIVAAAVFLVGALGLGFVLSHDSRNASRYTVLLTPSKETSVQERIFRWNTALADVDRHPLGHGLGTGGSAAQKEGRLSTIGSINLDNSYLEIALDQGLFVMGIFAMGALLLLISLARRSIATDDPERAAVGIGACGALAGFLVACLAGLFIEGLTALTLWVIVGAAVRQFAFREDRATIRGSLA